MYTLFLDDERNPSDVTWAPIPNHQEILVARNYQQFRLTVATRGVPSYVSFDHDLADVHYQAMLREVNGIPADYGLEQTGFDCAKWLVEHCNVTNAPFPAWAVHSMNPVGAERIRDYIASAFEIGFIQMQLPS